MTVVEVREAVLAEMGGWPGPGLCHIGPVEQDRDLGCILERIKIHQKVLSEWCDTIYCTTSNHLRSLNTAFWPRTYWCPTFCPNTFLLKIIYRIVLTMNRDMVDLKEESQESTAVIWQLIWFISKQWRWCEANRCGNSNEGRADVACRWIGLFCGLGDVPKKRHSRNL